MAAYDVINGTAAALATGGSTAAAMGKETSVTLSDANLATLGGLASVAVVKTASSAAELRNIVEAIYNDPVMISAKKGWRRW